MYSQCPGSNTQIHINIMYTHVTNDLILFWVEHMIQLAPSGVFSNRSP